MRQPAEDRVELQKMCERRVVGEIVDGDHFDVCTLAVRLLRIEGPVEAASDSTETVDAYSNCHVSLLNLS